MLKPIFWFVVGSAISVAFFAGMLFIFGQTTRVDCRHTEPTGVSCSVSSVLLGLLPLPGWKLDQVVNAQVEEDCSDGCTYRTDLVTRTGQSRPLSDVWTDEEAADNAMAAQINDFIASAGVAALVVTKPPAAWVIWLLGGLGVMSLVIQGLVLLGQLARQVFAPRSSASGVWR